MVVLGGEVGDDAVAGTLHGGTLVEHLERCTHGGGDTVAFTFLDHVRDPDGERVALTWSQLGTRVRAVAAQLQQVAQPGDRAAVLAGQGADYVIGFLGAVHAGLVAVPLFAPDQPGQSGRLGATLADCSSAVVLTGTTDAPAVRPFLDAAARPRPRLVAVDAVPDELAARWTDPATDPEQPAYLQYTSGSTRDPAGVVISHRAAVANVDQLVRAYGLAAGHNAGVSWLPLFHDMGLLFSVLIPALTGIPSTIMDPRAFVQRPIRWLRELAATPGAYTAAPDFSYQHCVRRVRPADIAGLRLDRVRVMVNGAEPVHAATITAFAEAFAPCGLDPAVHRPSYGMAEATVYISASPPRAEPRVTAFDRDALAEGTAVIAGDAARVSRLASCGVPIGMHVVVVDPQTRTAHGAGRVGEIWVAGPNLGSGYWQRPEESAAVFGAHLAGAVPPGAPDGPWLRTGDLGVIHDGELYITGRLKDLVIVDGRNHYPQDLEATTTDAHRAIRRGYVAAFSVPSGPDGDGPEALVVVAERATGPDGDGGDGTAAAEVSAAVRRLVADRHGVTLRELVLAPPGSVPRTSSGKLARHACRARYLDGTLVLAGAAS